MDAIEKRVMRWKRHLIASNVVWSDDFVRALKQRHLVSDGVLLQIEPEATSFSRMTRYIELLVKDAAWFGAGSTGDFVRTPFHSFCDIIENEGCQPWVAEELRTELKTERGEMAIEEYIRKEASQLVHRLYGANKRLPETEKRRLESVLALRTQCTKEVWKRNLELTQARLEDVKATARSQAADMINATRFLQDAVRDQRKALEAGGSGSKVAFSSDYVVNYRTGRESLPLLPDIHGKNGIGRTGSGQSGNEVNGTLSGGGKMNGGGRNVDEADAGLTMGRPRNWSGDDTSGRYNNNNGNGNNAQYQRWDGIVGLQTVAAALSDAADQIRRMTDAWTAERDRLRAERSRALVTLGIRDNSANPTSALSGSAPRVDVELQATLQRLNAELSCAKERAVDAEERANSLEERIRSARGDVEEELRSKDRTIALLTGSLERAEKEAEASNGEARELKRQVQLLKSELARYSVKSRYLEKSRHLGYIRDLPDSVEKPVQRRGSHSWASSPAVVTRSPIDNSVKQKSQNGNGTPVSQSRTAWRTNNTVGW